MMWTQMNMVLVSILLLFCLEQAGADNQMHSKAAPKVTRPRIDMASRCVSCEVNGVKYKGHSRFSYEKDCERFRCICRCDGSYDCPALYTRTICSDTKKPGSVKKSPSLTSSSSSSSSSSKSSSSSSSSASSLSSSSSASSSDKFASQIFSSVTKAQRKRCRSCVIQGQEYQGHSYFSHVDGCTKYDKCVCRCDGSWQCPADRVLFICNDEDKSKSTDGEETQTETSNYTETSTQATIDSVSQTAENTTQKIETRQRPSQRCQTCYAGGIERRGNSYFELDETCVKYRYCICRCNGSWNCPQRFAQNTCREQEIQDSTPESRVPARCNTCKVKDRSFQGNASFRVRDGCVEYSNCTCHCNGSWECPASGAKNICQPPKVQTCQECEVMLKKYPGNAYFSVKYGCIEYSNCICHCNGSWSCPPNGTKNTCGGPNPKSGVSGFSRYSYSRNSQSSSSENGRSPASVNTRQTSSSNVTHTASSSASSTKSSGMAKSSSSVNAKPVTPGHASASGVRTNTSGTAQCKRCLAFGKYFQGGSNFDVINRCTRYRNCICKCDGSWQCKPQFSTNICERHNSGSVNTSATLTHSRTSGRRQQCSLCQAKGKVVKGNSYFNMTDGCFEFKNCLCRCDGSWDCPPHYTKDRCKTTGRLKTKGPFGCQNCIAKGKIVNSQSKFSLIDGCTRYTDCNCNCDGSWQCLPENGQNICFNNTKTTGGCLQCKSLDNRLHKPNSPFTFVKDCVEYNCDCSCNGSWSCPANRSRWVCKEKCLDCDVKGRKIDSNTTFTHRTGCLEYTCGCHCNGSWSCPGKSVKNTCPAGVNVNCNKCIVSPREQYDGETDFVLRQDCLHYKCRCNCDGSYTCPGKDARNICRGEQLGGCRSCAVSENEIFRGETDFSFRKGCINYQCHCNCNGSWSCPAKDARDVCLGEVPGGCRVCKVNDKEVYRANTIFDLKKGCINYKCKCNCNGGWSCPGKDARDVCKGEVPGGCRSCKVSENEFYPGNSNFEMVKNCIHYKCRCHCNGGHSCPGRTARRVCRTASSVSAAVSTCNQCKISDKEIFSGNSSFFLERDCKRYECTCDCNGSWKCPVEKTKDICKQRQRPSQLVKSQCRPCKVRDDIVPSESTFKLKRGCNEFNCTCGCTGKWSCDTNNRINTCRLRKQRNRKPSLRIQAPATPRRHVLTASKENVPRESVKGKTYLETDIQSRRERISTDTTTSNSKMGNHGNNVQVNYYTNTGNCKKCNVGQDVKMPNEVFEIDTPCIKYKNCLCLCSGRWQCAEEVNVCNTRDAVNRVSSASSRSRSVSRSGGGGGSGGERKEVSSYVSSHAKDSKHVVQGTDKAGRKYAISVDADYVHNGKIGPVRSNRLAAYTDQKQILSSESSLSNPHSDASLPVSSSSSSSSLSSSSSSSLHSSIPMRSGLGSNLDKDRCTKCSADGKKYTAGAKFNMYRGCVLYKCTCLCSGSYRCNVMSDEACTEGDRRDRCNNCVYHGMVFPGNMSFSVREGCSEKTCQCNCDGSYTCPSSSLTTGCIPGQIRGSQSSSSSSIYQANAKSVPVSTGYLKRTPSNIHPCTNNCQESRRTRVRSEEMARCTGCNVEGRKHAGNSSFAIQKGCVYFDCFCECQGSWKCSGRKSQDCRGPEIAPPRRGCRKCLVQETEYPPNSKFSLRQECFEYKCGCNCDGSWACPAQEPAYKCVIQPQRRTNDRIEPFSMRDDSSIISTNNNVQTTQTSDNSHDTLRSSRLQYRRYSNVRERQCKECKIDGQVFIPEKDFELLRNKCYLYNCRCHCNGMYTCPPDQVQNICSRQSPHNTQTGVSVQVGKSTEDKRGESSRTVEFAGCKRCFLHGEHIAPLGRFVQQLGCFETLCQCQCNGEASCPDNDSVNICELEDKKAMRERPGCKVGRRTHFTRVFAVVEDCFQRVCICHDDGTWACRKSARDKKVC